jgi:hypothetical protein
MLHGCHGVTAMYAAALLLNYCTVGTAHCHCVIANTNTHCNVKRLHDTLYYSVTRYCRWLRMLVQLLRGCAHGCKL